jgi:hypothetical protein
MKKILLIALIAFLIPFFSSAVNGNKASDTKADEQIKPYDKNRMYWQYKGKPVMLLGGSWQDNLFNHPERLAEHLDLLLSVGGNYVRNTMSHRNIGNVFAYEREADGRFNLDVFNDEYWQRFENFLDLCYKRDIIVQIEVWDPWDHYEDHQSLGGWSHHPFNPKNNRTYSSAESRMTEMVNYPPRGEPSEHPFFRTVPALENNGMVLKYQQAYVDKMLSISLKYPNVLYCINNESGERIEWSDYWADYIHKVAQKNGVSAQVTEMRRNEDVRAADHKKVFDNTRLYTFLDISQNNAWSGLGQGHYDNIMFVRDYISDNPRPVNNIKNYGATRHGEDESVARFCRIVFAGCASARFHRPHPLEDPAAHQASTDFGLGLSPLAQSIIRSMRWVTDQIDFTTTEPRNDLLSGRDENEAFLLAESGRQYALYFPKGGEVRLDLTAAKGQWEVLWRNVLDGTVQNGGLIGGGKPENLKTPGSGHWAAVLKSKKY